MSLARNIRIKALLLLVIFSGNFFAVCRCSAEPAMCGRAMQHSCCRKDGMASDKDNAAVGKEKPTPCKGNCPGAQAIKFNLSDKQVATVVHVSPLAASCIAHTFTIALSGPVMTDRNYSPLFDHRHSPPDLLAFYHCYLI